MSERHDYHQTLAAVQRRAQEKLDKLCALDPLLIDVSLRENPVGAPAGQTLEDKLAILPLIRDFGFSRIVLGTLNYSLPDECEVDDDFMLHLRDRGMDVHGGYAFTSIGRVDARGAFSPDPSMLKLRDYGVPNSLHELYLSDAGMHANCDMPTLKRSLAASVDWMLANIRGDDGGRAKLIINVVDGCDALAQHPERTCDMLAFIADLPVEGVSLEDGRGVFMPFQIAAFVEMARTMLPAPLQLLVHLHSGGGFENAAVLEALAHGADGVWGAMPKQAAMIGHASLAELLANLVRLGNFNVARRYDVDRLLPLVRELQAVGGKRAIPDDAPVLGRHADRLTLSAFQQVAGRCMDLPPEALGGVYRYRICPVVSDPSVVAGRLAEVTGRPAGHFSEPVLEAMIRLMRRELRDGLRIVYDEPENLLQLHRRACRWQERSGSAGLVEGA